METNNIISKIRSLQISDIKTINDENKTWQTGSFKTPIQKAEITTTGIKGDKVADTKHHGGIDKAVFANSYKNYAKWQSFLKLDKPLEYGALAENLTVEKIDEDDVFIGDIHQIGEVILEVSQPREPCWKIGQKWHNKYFTKYIYDSGETGWYYRVLKTGMINQDDEIKLLKRVNDTISIKKANEILREPKNHPHEVNYLLNLDVLSEAWKNSLKKRVVK